MGLFTRDKKDEKKQTPKMQPMQQPQTRTVSPYEIHHRTQALQRDLQQLSSDYRAMLESGETLDLQAYQQLIVVFSELATPFELIYEMMKFELERLESIQEYNSQAKKKFNDLIQTFADEQAKDLAKEEQDDKSGKGKK